MKVQIVDPPAFTPPYDRSLCAALARSGADVELVTSTFSHGPVPPAEGYRVAEAFYRHVPALIAVKVRNRLPAEFIDIPPTRP